MSSPDANTPQQNQPEERGIFHTLWETIKTERMLAVVLAGSALVAMMIIELAKSGVTVDGFRATFNAMLVPASVIAFVIFVMGSMRNTVLGRTFTFLILIYFLAGMKQFLFAPYPPPMPPFYCFMSITAEGCPGSPKYNWAALNQAPAEVIGEPATSADVSESEDSGAPVIDDAPASSTADPFDASAPADAGAADGVDPITTGSVSPEEGTIDMASTDADATAMTSEEPGGGGGGTTSAETETAAQVVSPGPVFTQFAGSLHRDKIKALAAALSDQGWKMQGAANGGERTTAAAGLNEVRFFYPEDRQYAEALAQAVIGIADWVPEMKVVDLSNSGYQPPKGQLEIWTSR